MEQLAENIQNTFKEKYSDLIGSMTLAVPNGCDTFDVISFDSYIERIYPDQKKFITSELEKIKREVCNKYGNDRTCFKELGQLQEVQIDHLKFYQPKVGINGPRHSNIDEPVFILVYENSLLLYNGYHRVLHKIIHGESIVKGYLLSLD